MPVSFAPRVAGRWSAPAGLTVRGTVVVLPGRGEHGEVYERLARRLAFDAYEVVALDALPTTPITELAEVVAGLEDQTRPLVLLGSDTGALEALQIAATAGDLVQAVVAAGLPTEASLVDWAAELDARTACPAHRARLEADDRFDRRGLEQPVPAALTVSRGRFAGPVLVLHGSADRLTSVDLARDVAASLPQGELAVVEGGRHDVLNDLAHRSVAAEIVQFLERVRVSDAASSIIRRTS